MAMPKSSDKPAIEEPMVPRGPTAPPAPARDAAEAQQKNDAPDKTASGRRSYDDVLAELKVLQPRVEELRRALAPLAALPEDATKAAGEVLYELARGGRQATLTCGDIRRARDLLGIPH